MSNRASGPPPVPHAPSPRRPLRILLADDEPVVQLLCGTLLRERGHDFTSAPDGRQALERLRRDRFDVAILDLLMPEMDGLEVARGVRGAPGPNRETTIIALTGLSSAEDRERCFAVGMDDYQAKPIDPEAFVSLIETPRRAPASTAAGASAVSPVARGAPDGPDFPRSLARVGGRREVLERMVRTFLAHAAPELAALEEFVARRDPDGAARAAHRLLGGLLQFDAHEAAARAREIELLGRNGDADRMTPAGGALRTPLTRACAILQTWVEPR